MKKSKPSRVLLKGGLISGLLPKAYKQLTNLANQTPEGAAWFALIVHPEKAEDLADRSFIAIEIKKDPAFSHRWETKVLLIALVCTNGGPPLGIQRETMRNLTIWDPLREDRRAYIRRNQRNTEKYIYQNKNNTDDNHKTNDNNTA